MDDFARLYEKAIRVVGSRQLSATAEAGAVGAAILTVSGHIYVGVCLDMACSVGFCAEHAAAAAMITAGENVITKVIAVNKQGNIIPPCGRCREFLSQLADANMDAEVKIAEGTVCRLRDLIPYDWRQA